MKDKENILQELSELKSTLANITPQNVYTVPVGYFDGLVFQVLNRIKAMEAKNTTEELSYLSPSLINISRLMPYTVPAGYFEEIAENLMPLIGERNDYHTAQEEIETLSPLLSGLKKQIPYSVPDGYFDNLVEKTNKPAAKVVSITHRKWFRYAAAAVVTGVAVLTGFIFFGKSDNEKEAGGLALANFTREIQKMDDMQKDNLMDFIDAGMSGNETAQLNTDSRLNEVKELLKGVSDKELKEFQEQSEDIEDVLMTN